MNFQFIAIGVAVALSVGFGSGWLGATKWHQAGEYKELQGAINALTIDAQTKIKTLDEDWRTQVAARNEILVKAGEVRAADAAREGVILSKLEGVNSEIRKLRTRITDDVGVCRLDDEFIRLWNDLARTARAGSPEAGGDHTP